MGGYPPHHSRGAGLQHNEGITSSGTARRPIIGQIGHSTWGGLENDAIKERKEGREAATLRKNKHGMEQLLRDVCGTSSPRHSCGHCGHSIFDCRFSITPQRIQGRSQREPTCRRSPGCIHSPPSSPEFRQLQFTRTVGYFLFVSRSNAWQMQGLAFPIEKVGLALGMSIGRSPGRS